MALVKLTDILKKAEHGAMLPAILKHGMLSFFK